LLDALGGSTSVVIHFHLLGASMSFSLAIVLGERAEAVAVMTLSRARPPFAGLAARALLECDARLPEPASSLLNALVRRWALLGVVLDPLDVEGVQLRQQVSAIFAISVLRAHLASPGHDTKIREQRAPLISSVEKV
jgi:hypothetical protein